MGSILDVSEKRAGERWGGGVSTPEGLHMSQVSGLFCFWQAVRDVSSICNRSDTPFMYRWPDQSILLISVEIHDLLPSLNEFFPSRFKKYMSNMIHKTVFQTDFGDYKNILRPPPPLVCKLMQLTKAFLTGNHSEDRSRKGRKDRKLEILRYF